MHPFLWKIVAKTISNSKRLHESIDISVENITWPTIIKTTVLQQNQCFIMTFKVFVKIDLFLAQVGVK